MRDAWIGYPVNAFVGLQCHSLETLSFVQPESGQQRRMYNAGLAREGTLLGRRKNGLDSFDDVGVDVLD